jgi:membrane protein required for colicin V production
MTYSWLDLLLIALPLLGAIGGFRHGMVKEISGIIGLIAAIYAAINLSDWAKGFIRPYVEWTDNIVSFAAFVGVLLGVMLVVALFAKLIESLLGFMMLGGINRIIGAVVGMLKGFLWLSMVLLIVDAVDRRISFIPQEARNKSALYEPFRKIVVSIFPTIIEKEWFELERVTEDPLPPEVIL